MEYLAHYNEFTKDKQLLSTHLHDVSALIYNQIPPNVVFDEICNSTVKDIAYWIGFFHDLGKYTDYFQSYLYGKNSNYKNHAHISACFIYSWLNNKIILSEKDKNILVFFAYISIRLHHTGLRLDSLFPNRHEIHMKDELKVIEENLVKKSKKIIKDIGIDESIDEEIFRQYLNTSYLLNETSHLKYMPQLILSGRISEIKLFFLLLYFFSLLIDCDKLDSAAIDKKGKVLISSARVDEYLNHKHGKNRTEEFYSRREKARQSMIQVVEDLSDEEVKQIRFYTLTAPTGIGKTLSSLQCALRLQERINMIEGYTPKIITAIPFINIVEQNKKEYENVFGDSVNMVVHHRLSDFWSGGASAENIPVDKALLETESWEGDVILTTFVQLFQSIFTGKNKMLKKLNKLAGSIVILDEAQALPEEYMPLIGAVLQKISEYYGTRFILMTATQPKLLEFGYLLLNDVKKQNKKSVSLLPEYEEYFKELKRTKFVPILEKRLNNEDFISLFKDKWDYNKSVLIVVNTIKRSIDIYEALKGLIDQQNLNIPVKYLSTNTIPLKRRRVINQVKEILNRNGPIVLVSTQTIEAGVDLDFDMAFRDFAPIDSLIQTAGRVNREGKKGEFLPIYIVQLESDNHFIYQLIHRETTIQLLAEKEINETEYGTLVENYYSKALERGVSDKSLEIWKEGIMKLDFDIIQKFKLIENPEEVCDVFVEDGSNVATLLADAYEELLIEKEEVDIERLKIINNSIAYRVNKKISVFERKALLELVKARMNDYIIQVRAFKITTNKLIKFKDRGSVDAQLFWIPPYWLNQYYDEETGFISNNGEAFIL